MMITWVTQGAAEAIEAGAKAGQTMEEVAGATEATTTA
jgi:hypothetical protein